MNIWGALSIILTIASLLLIGIALFVDEGWMFAAWPFIIAAVWFDHLSIEKELRDFLNREA